jgi:hypothetical protein
MESDEKESLITRIIDLQGEGKYLDEKVFTSKQYLEKRLNTTEQ